jgi:hypothetical protein
MTADPSASHKMTSSYAWRIERWSLLRGLVLLVSSLLSVTILHYVILAIF